MPVLAFFAGGAVGGAASLWWQRRAARTREKEVESRLTGMSRNLDVALGHMQRGLCLYDADERLVMANDRVCEIYGFEAHELQAGMRYIEVLDLARRRRGDRGGRVGAAVEVAYDRHRAFLQRPEGGSMMVEYADGMMLSVAERPLPCGGWVSTFDDVSERYRSEQRIRHMALHDALTDLPNREQFGERAAAELAQAAAAGSQAVIVSLDVDRFKDVNDRHGHRVADDVLRQMARRIVAALGGEGFAARMGGDEFSVIRAIADESEARALGHRLADALATTLTIDGLPIANSASVGLALYPQDGTTHEELHANAVMAMYRAKRSTERRVCRYNSEMDEDARANRALEADLHKAVDGDQFHLVYQVQCSVATGETLGYEALLRWDHPQLGIVPPDRFIPMAEDDGLIVPIGEWVLRRACFDAAGWAEPHKVAVNMSPVQLVQSDLPAKITEILLESGLPPSRLEIEITESAIISDKLRVLHNLRQIKALGVSVAIDDFGTGYASLDTLHSFEFDKIKIDRSFLMECTHKPQARAIIRAVLALGKSLGLPVLAEGVETQAHLELLRDEECAEAQGFFFGRPSAVVEQAEPAPRAAANG